MHASGGSRASLSIGASSSKRLGPRVSRGGWSRLLRLPGGAVDERLEFVGCDCEAAEDEALVETATGWDALVAGDAVVTDGECLFRDEEVEADADTERLSFLSN